MDKESRLKQERRLLESNVVKDDENKPRYSTIKKIRRRKKCVKHKPSTDELLQDYLDRRRKAYNALVREYIESKYKNK
jgi:hypothetical protein